MQFFLTGGLPAGPPNFAGFLFNLLETLTFTCELAVKTKKNSKIVYTLNNIYHRESHFLNLQGYGSNPNLIGIRGTLMYL